MQQTLQTQSTPAEKTLEEEMVTYPVLLLENPTDRVSLVAASAGGHKEWDVN